MRIAVLSNVTAEVLAGMLGERHCVWFPPGFGAWAETALAPPRAMVEFGPEAVFILLDKSRSKVDEALVQESRASLEAAFPSAAVVVPDLEDLAAETAGFYDERMWKAGSMPWSLAGLRAIEGEIERLLGAMKGQRKKALAVDFDNVLWSGTIGEDGVAAIRPLAAVQEWMKRLENRGIVLVGLSRNNPADVEPVWGDSRMVLSKDDFAALRIDWNDKSKNLVSVAKELNLGVDSFVFLDDSPAERAHMKAALPEVAVPGFPQDEGLLPGFLRRVERICFPEFRVLGEDRRKTAYYHEEAERRRYSTGLSADEYLRGLEMWADVHPVVPEEMARVAQLSQKSNQFNVLSSRHDEADIARFAADAGRVLLTVHAGDRFGDMGLVAFVQAVMQGEAATVVDWVMSCRAMNRRLEFAVEEALEARLAAAGVKTVHASWRRTAKNAPVENLFEAFGFSVIGGDENAKRYSLSLPRGEGLRHFTRLVR